MKTVLITFISLFLLSFGRLCAQDRSEVNNMVKALSYYKGIELTLRCIMEKYSSIAPIAVSQYGLLKMTHGRSVDSLNKELTKILGDDFLKFDKTISQTINCDFSESIAREYLKDLNNFRIRGNHDVYSEYVQLLLKYNPKYKNNSLKEFTDEFRTKFFTKGHLKSKGLDYSISFPKSWEVKEGSRPNIIIKAIDQRNPALSLMLITKELMPKDEFDLIIKEEGANIKSNTYKEQIAETIFTTEFISSLKEETTEFSNVIRTKIDGQPALMYFSRMPNERAGLKMEVFQNNVIVIYKNYLLTVSLGYVVPEDSSIIEYPKVENGNIDVLFKSIINTIVIEGQWK